ncbi:Hypothetical_protein [Hexamita inflata]|uniref:Hypothetical_protein n=1 Tax=Hexamita inflata TaxID=28002 RepID=A0AA86QX27_9EUKA|nr:Hypothetical protein HINF_LOCUS53368 [Hexamita inflata]
MKHFANQHQLRVTSTPITPTRTKSISLSSPSLRSCNQPTKIKIDIKPLKRDISPIYQPLDLDKLNLSDFTFEMNSEKMTKILMGFIDNISVNVHHLEIANLIRNQIQGLRITIQRLEEQILEATSQMNSMDFLCSKQVQMILSLKGM